MTNLILPDFGGGEREEIRTIVRRIMHVSIDGIFLYIFSTNDGTMTLRRRRRR